MNQPKFYYPGKQEVAPQAECPECVEQEELIWIGSGEDGHLAEYYCGDN